MQGQIDAQNEVYTVIMEWWIILIMMNYYRLNLLMLSNFNNISVITPQKIINKIHNPYILHTLERYSRNRQMIESRNIYNKQACNINKFIQQEKEFNRKINIPRQQKTTTNNNPIQRYDQNQHLLLKLNHNIFTKTKHPLSLSLDDQISNNKDDSIKQNKVTNFRRSTIVRINKIFPRLKSKTTIDNPNSLNFMKIKIKTQKASNISRNNDDGTKRSILSPNSIRKQSNKQYTQNSLQLGADRPQIYQITDERLQKCYQHLKQLLKQKNKNQQQEPNQKMLNDLIIERFQLKNNPFLQDQHQPIIKLQICDFSTRESRRKTISSLVNMSFKNSQNLAFDIYDINQNGIIDQKDIISIIQLSEYFPNLDIDLGKILRNAQYRNIGYANAKTLSNNQQQIEKQSITKSKNSKSKIKQTKIQLQNSLSTSFKKQKMFIFFQTITNDFKVSKIKNAQNCKISITKHKFRNMFEKQRPAIFYDLIKFLFGLELQMLKTRQPRKRNAQSKNSQSSVKQKPNDFITYIKNTTVRNMEVQKFNDQQ